MAESLFPTDIYCARTLQFEGLNCLQFVFTSESLIDCLSSFLEFQCSGRMIVHCWMCNYEATLPAGPACRVNPPVGGSAFTRTQFIGLCKALEVSPDDFLEDLYSSYSCKTCSRTVEEIVGVSSTLDKLQSSLVRLRNDVKKSLEIATGIPRKKEDVREPDATKDTGKEKLDIGEVKLEIPDESGGGAGDGVEDFPGVEVEDQPDQQHVLKEDVNWKQKDSPVGKCIEEAEVIGDQNCWLDMLRLRIIKCMDGGKNDPVLLEKNKDTQSTRIYADLEKDRKLLIKLTRLDASKVKNEINEDKKIKDSPAKRLTLSGDDSVDWDWSATIAPVYMESSSNMEEESVQSAATGVRKSLRKRKPTKKIIQEESDQETEPKKKRLGNKKEEVEDGDYEWIVPSDDEMRNSPYPHDEDDEDYEITYDEASGQKIKLMQYKGKKIKTDSVYCEKCNRNYGSKFDLQTHMKKRHQGIYRPHFCDVPGCGKAFRLRSSWLHHKEFHVRGDVPEKRFVCKECGKGYETNNSLQRHISVHTGHWKYPCTQEGCNKGFHRPSELRAHIRLHKNQLEFKCNYCDEKFATKRKRIFHESSEHPDERLDKNTMCEYCLKVFSSADALRCHKIQVHAEESKFRCEDCGHGFAKRSWLNRHKLQHSEEKSFNCEYCEEKFRFPNSLAVHRMKHEGKFPHVCDVCEKKFTLFHQLKIHQLVHSKEKSYVCEYCGKTFNIHTYLRHHVKRMHFKELGMTELPPYYLKERNRKKTKKPPKISEEPDENLPDLASTLSVPLEQIKLKRKKKLNKSSANTQEDHSKEMECHNLISGMNVGEEALIITDANGSTNVEVEFVNVGVLEYVVHTTESYEPQDCQDEHPNKSDDGEEVSIEQVEVHELETQKIETDPYIEFIVTEAN